MCSKQLLGDQYLLVMKDEKIALFLFIVKSVVDTHVHNEQIVYEVWQLIWGKDLVMYTI